MNKTIKAYPRVFFFSLILIAIFVGSLLQERSVFHRNLWSVYVAKEVFGLPQSNKVLPPDHHPRKEVWQGLLFYKQGRDEDALNVVRARVTEAPEDHLAHRTLGDLLYHTGDTKGAIHEWSKTRSVYKIADAAWSAYSDRRLDDALFAFERLWEISPEAGTLGLANTYLATGNTVDALSVLDRALRDMPNQAESLSWKLLLGQVLIEEERWQEAESIYQDIVAVHPNVAEAHIRLGQVLYKLNGFSEAASVIEQGILLSPFEPLGYMILGDIYSEEKRYREAGYTYKEAAFVDPNNKWIWIRIAHNSLEQRNMPQVIENNNVLLSKFMNEMSEREMTDSYCSLALAYHNLSDQEQALEFTDKAIKGEVSSSWCWYLAGQIYEMSGNERKALFSFQQAVTMDPDYEEALIKLESIQQ